MGPLKAAWVLFVQSGFTPSVASISIWTGYNLGRTVPWGVNLMKKTYFLIITKSMLLPNICWWFRCVGFFMQNSDWWNGIVPFWSFFVYGGVTAELAGVEKLFFLLGRRRYQCAYQFAFCMGLTNGACSKLRYRRFVVPSWLLEKMDDESKYK